VFSFRSHKVLLISISHIKSKFREQEGIFLKSDSMRGDMLPSSRIPPRFEFRRNSNLGIVNCQNSTPAGILPCRDPDEGRNRKLLPGTVTGIPVAGTLHRESKGNRNQTPEYPEYNYSNSRIWNHKTFPTFPCHYQVTACLSRRPPTSLVKRFDSFLPGHYQ